MASILQTARVLYDLGKADTDLVNTWTTERATLANNIATDASFSVAISSATVNGQSYSGDVVMTNLERLRLLDAVLKHISAGVPPSSRTSARF